MVYGPIALGAAGLIAFVIVEGVVDAPMMPLRIFRSKTFSGANLVTFLMYAAFGAAFFFLPFALIQVYGYTATEAGAAFLPIIIILFVLSRWAGGLVDRYGAKLPLIIGPAVGALGYLLFILLGRDGSYFLTFFPGMFVLGLGLGLSVAPLTTAVMNAVEVSFSGTASGVNNAVSRVGGLLAIAVLGIVILYSFNSHLDAQMDVNGVPADVRETFEDERIKLAGAEIPLTLGDEMKAKLEGMVRGAYVKGFHLVLYIAASLSLMSAIVAWLTIGRKETGEPGEVEECET